MPCGLEENVIDMKKALQIVHKTMRIWELFEMLWVLIKREGKDTVMVVAKVKTS